jgi:hypothetical protein
MLSPIDQYRDLAAEARRKAAACDLPQVRLRHLSSAEHFDGLAAALEEVAQCKVRNEVAKTEPVTQSLGSKVC